VEKKREHVTVFLEDMTSCQTHET